MSDCSDCVLQHMAHAEIGNATAHAEPAENLESLDLTGCSAMRNEQSGSEWLGRCHSPLIPDDIVSCRTKTPGSEGADKQPF